MSTTQDKPATAEFMAAQSFEDWDKAFLDKLPDAEQQRTRARDLDICIRASAVVMTYDDEELEDMTKTDDQVETCIELVQEINDRVELSKAELALLESASSRLMVALSRFELSLENG